MYYENNTLYCCRDCFSITKRIIFIDKITVIKFTVNIEKPRTSSTNCVGVFFFNSVLYYRNINLKKNPLIYLNLYHEEDWRNSSSFYARIYQRIFEVGGGLRDNFVRGGGGCSGVILITLFC